jgi:hypothetical protein
MLYAFWAITQSIATNSRAAHLQKDKSHKRVQYDFSERPFLGTAGKVT